jgi:hypothetical protein
MFARRKLNDRGAAVTAPSQRAKARRSKTMSTDYRPLSPIFASELFDGRLEQYGVREHVKPIDKHGHGTTEFTRMLTEGRSNYLWVFINDDGTVLCFTRYAPNGNPSRILNAIFETFDVEIFSEHEPQFWGFETQEEWDKSMDEMERKHDQECLVDLVKYLRCEKHGFRRGTNGMAWAKNVKKFFKKDPTLILPENRDKLLKLFKDGSALTSVVVELSPEDIAMAEMMATHEDDLPQA